jgi:hypothetical protein
MEESKPQRTVTIGCTNEKAIPYRNDSLAEYHGFRGGRKIPVVIMGNGEDQVGSLFVSALKERLSHSANYKPVHFFPRYGHQLLQSEPECRSMRSRTPVN